MTNAVQRELVSEGTVKRGFRPSRGYAALMWLLSILFALRVFGQAFQRWMPQSILPSFDHFQGSNLPYWLLLSAQLAIVAAMVHYSWRTQTGKLVPRRRAGRVLAWAGSIYMIGSLARLAIGLTLPVPPTWFMAWIPAIFHLVLAGFVLTLAAYHRSESHLLSGEAQK
jgi:hypothetical protein